MALQAFKEITGLPVYDFLSVTYSSVQRPILSILITRIVFF